MALAVSVFFKVMLQNRLVFPLYDKSVSYAPSFRKVISGLVYVL